MCILNSLHLWLQQKAALMKFKEISPRIALPNHSYLTSFDSNNFGYLIFLKQTSSTSFHTLTEDTSACFLDENIHHIPPTTYTWYHSPSFYTFPHFYCHPFTALYQKTFLKSQRQHILILVSIEVLRYIEVSNQNRFLLCGHSLLYFLILLQVNSIYKQLYRWDTKKKFPWLSNILMRFPFLSLRGAPPPSFPHGL